MSSAVVFSVLNVDERCFSFMLSRPLAKKRLLNDFRIDDDDEAADTWWRFWLVVVSFMLNAIGENW